MCLSCCVCRAGIKRAVAEHKPKIVFLTSPNNPDGSMLTEQELLEILALPVLVVLVSGRWGLAGATAPQAPIFGTAPAHLPPAPAWPLPLLVKCVHPPPAASLSPRPASL